MYENLVKTAKEQGCLVAVLYLRLELDSMIFKEAERVSEKLESELESKEAMLFSILSYNDVEHPRTSKDGELLPEKCPKCGSDAKGRIEFIIPNKEFRMSCECSECKIRFIEKYEKRGSQWALISKEVVE